jgi:hypothetical protein
MKRVDDLFVLHRAKSGLFTEYEPGPVAYIGNGFDDNATVGFVTPLANDRVFRSRALVVSAFCEATVQMPPFVACGRAGNGLVVLEPRTLMTSGQLAYIGAYINQAVRWRFNWYRQVTADRLRSLLIPDAPPPSIPFPVRSSLPAVSPPTQRTEWDVDLAPFALDAVFDMQPGHYHALNGLSPGDVPVVSCGDRNNGIAGYFDIPAHHLHDHKLTIAMNGSTLAPKYHPYAFAAKDDVAVCVPREAMALSTMLFVEVMLKREQWRYSYYRKAYLDKLRRFEVLLPARRGVIDAEAIRKVVNATPYWTYLEQRLGKLA